MLSRTYSNVVSKFRAFSEILFTESTFEPVLLPSKGAKGPALKYSGGIFLDDNSGLSSSASRVFRLGQLF